MDARTQRTTNALLEGLNEPQAAAVQHTDGALLILAGPGSGKTRVVTRRVAYLAQTETAPYHILAITFTNKAAKEMQERIKALSVPRGVVACTFHSLCARLLRQHADRAGLPRNFTIMDRDDRRTLLKQAIERCDLSTTNYKPAAADYVISNAKNRMETAEVFATAASDWRERAYARIYAAYEALLREQGGLDFDDLLMRMALLLTRDASLREELADRFRFVLVDEYQDTNAAQYRIARAIAQAHGNLCVTGDPDQSIYGWRGADIQNILSFDRDFPDATVIRLEQNYRSTKRVLAAADAVIAGNLQRKKKTLWTENPDGPKIRVWALEDGDEEARSVARDVKSALRDGISAADMAVFYRVNSLSRALEEAFIQEGVAYQVARGVAFYNRREIKDVLAYLRVLVNPSDEVSLKRIINTPTRGIGGTTVERLVAEAKRRGCRLYDVIVGEALPDAIGRSAGKVVTFGALLRSLAPALQQPPSDALKFVMSRSGLSAFYKEDRRADETAGGNLDELVNAAAVFEGQQDDATLIDWIEHAALISDVDGLGDEGGRVTLMTLHAAKGLEFRAVYMIGLEDGLLPMRRNGEVEDDEEERRLCFVGMTRSKERLTLSHARFRMMRGLTERTIRSPYLDELPSEDVALTSDKPRRTKRRTVANNGRLPQDVAEWEIGTLVRHPDRGLGQILSLERGARRTHVTVMFESGERLSFVLEFADLQRVDFHDVG